MIAPHDAPPAVRDALLLSLVPGVGPHLHQALSERLGSATAVLDAPLSQLRAVPGIGAKLAQRIAGARQEWDVEAELEFCHRCSVGLLARDDPDYPAPLLTIHDPPPLLYVRGRVEPRDAVALAIVGARRCTHYGQRQAERFAAGLARIGMTIVSGLARGIDVAAHRGALAAGGRTIAVLAGGLGAIYPPEHAAIADDVARQGALISEMPMRQAPFAGLFPQRNRIISGLSLGVLVVEAERRSGALITAHHAMEQGREVFAVPGHIDSLASHGCHQLIRDGVHLTTSVDDILQDLGPLVCEAHRPDGPPVRHPAELVLNEPETAVLGLLADDPVHADDLVHRSRLTTAQVLSVLSVLEIRGLIRRLPGNLYVRR